MEAVNYFLVINFIFATSGQTVLLVVDAECEACFWPSCLHKTHKPTLSTYIPWSCTLGWCHSYVASMTLCMYQNSWNTRVQSASSYIKLLSVHVFKWLKLLHVEPFLFRHHTLMIHSYNIILRHWYYACSHSSSPIAFITSIPCCCGTAVFHSVTYSLIYYLYNVEIPADGITDLGGLTIQACFPERILQPLA